jgi:tetratricopeptide (TPR) repeat protein
MTPEADAMREHAQGNRTSGASGGALFPAVVFACALALRVVSLALFLRTPYALYPVLDARRFYEWALGILAGSPAPGPFLYEPLYAYVQVGIYALAGINFHHVLVFQAVAGSLGAVLAYFILLDHLPPRWSLAGALAYAAYPVTLLADTLPIKEPLATVLLLAALLLLQRHARSGRPQTLFLAGLVLGLVFLVRENLLALGPFLFLYLFAVGGGVAVAVRRAGLLLLGVALAVLPVTARNCVVGGDCVLVAASGGSNLFMAFNERSRGDSFVQPSFARSGPARLTEDSIAEAARRAGRPVTASEASRFWSREALRYVLAHPARSAGLLAQRFWVSLGNDEISGNYPHEFFSRVNPLIGFNPLGFGLIFAFGAVGWWCVRGDRSTLIFPAVFFGTWVSFLPFWTLDRFRLPAILPLIAGSLFAIRELVRQLRLRDTRGAGALCLAVALVLAVSLPPRLDARRRAESVGLAYARGADLYLQGGDVLSAGAYLDEARRTPLALPEISLVAARYFAAVGRPDEALRELAVFRVWRRDFEDAELLQARLLAAQGERAAARRVLEEYLAAWPESTRAAQAFDDLK